MELMPGQSAPLRKPNHVTGGRGRVLGKTTDHGMALWPCRSGSGERRACPRRRCPNQKKQRRIGTPSRKSRSKSGFVGFSLETKHAFAKAPCLSYFIGQRVCESDKLWLAGPHLRMCDRRAVNLQKRVHSSRLLVVSAAIFVYRGLLP